jgi:hypothetical protein
MGIFYSYCTRCNKQLRYFIEYGHDGIECDVCSHFNIDSDVKGTLFKYNNGRPDGALNIWGEEIMESKMKRKIKHSI